MRRALLLNADYSPLHFVPDVEAFVMVYKETAEIANLSGKDSVWEGEELTSPGRSWPCPATVRLLERVNKKWKSPRFRKKVLFNRDGWKCQYCRVDLNWSNITIEHVMPKSRGGPTTWLNCVSACKPCNKRKANKTPEEAGMTLIKPAAPPTPMHFWDVSKSSQWHEDWTMLIPRS